MNERGMRKRLANILELLDKAHDEMSQMEDDIADLRSDLNQAAGAVESMVIAIDDEDSE